MAVMEKEKIYNCPPTHTHTHVNFPSYLKSIAQFRIPIKPAANWYSAEH